MMSYKTITKTVESIDSVIYYQIDCIREHDDLHILPIHVAAQDKQALLEIDISGKINCLDYISVNTFSRNEWICLLLSVFEPISRCTEYFLEPSCFELSLSTIFFKIGQTSLDFNNIYLIYFPVLQELNNDPIHSLCYEFLQYISALPVNSSDWLFSDDEQDIILKMSFDSLNNGIDYFKSLLKNETASDRIRNNKFTEDSHTINKNTEQKNELRVFNYIALMKRNIFDFIKRDKSEPSDSHVFAVPLFALFIEIILICLSLIIYKQKEYFPGEIIPIILISAILLICGIIDLILLYNKKSPLYLIHTKKMPHNRHEDFISDSIFTSKEEKTVLLGKSAETTRIAMLCSGVPGTPEESMGLKAYILVDDFVVGRDSAKVDFKINSLSIGRIHARISRKENSFFIEDLGSKNGTFLDQKKLKKNDEYNLPDNCKIRFAEQEFYFVAN